MYNAVRKEHKTGIFVFSILCGDGTEMQVTEV
mgnify:FL=1